MDLRQGATQSFNPETKNMVLNLGPSHPAMHGVIRMVVELDGETIVKTDVEIGYMHRAFEKSCEQVSFNGCMPYTDRLNYVSPLINNIGFCLAVEKILGVTSPERGQYIRVIACEISRISDHLTCIGASAMELGSFTVFLYMIKAREFIWELVEELTGARLTVSFGRIGGVKADLPDGYHEKVKKAFKEVRSVLAECHKLLTRNRIFVDRMKNTGILHKEEALSYGITGPFLRGSGIEYDVRKAHPYLVYDRFQFEVPLGSVGDNLDRYLVRMDEMEQSMRITEQALEQIPGGPVSVNPETGEPVKMTGAEMVDTAKLGHIQAIAGKEPIIDSTLQGTGKRYIDDVSLATKSIVLPAKEDTFGNIEGLMNHFKLIMQGHGVRVPVGEAYVPVEGANGELGFTVFSDGSDRPYRVRCRPPCFPIVAAMPRLVEGDMLADLIPTFGSVNMIAGELER